MKEIPLTQGKVAIVDDEDYERLGQYRWYAWRSKRMRMWYARTNLPRPIARQTGRTCWLMHRLIMDAPAGVEIDHADGDGLHNSRGNLRRATHSEQMRNRRPDVVIAGGRKHGSKYKGVGWDKRARRWRARITADGKYITKNCRSERDAARAYNEMAKVHFGPFAWLNAVEE